jgi:uncharacterized protein
MPEVGDIFCCLRCGFCCQGETTVSLNEADQRRMVSALGLSEQEVEERFWRRGVNLVQMKTVDGHCIFYAEGCTVHPGRPWRCAQWPLHPSILSDENNFKTIADSCPGIKRGLGYDEFCRILRELLEKSAQGS